MNGTLPAQEESMLIDKSIGVFTNELIHHTNRVYLLASALSERDPSSESAFNLV
ncbi:MAG: hypothetical protein ACK521_10350 [bacterium]